MPRLDTSRRAATAALCLAALGGCSPALRPAPAGAPVGAQAPASRAPEAPAPASSAPEAPSPAMTAAPAVPREFRGVWVATVGNIDWPSKAGLPTAEQQRELIAILDRSKALNLNAVVLQVRPATDALYDSPLEPWSEYLTGQMGRAPSPRWDPLAFAVAEAHRRGLELHAWFNPYRARQAGAKGPASANHVSNQRPELVRQYGTMQWLDPGEPETLDWSLRVVRDVVRRYDIDGVHIDDYFYPYPENDARGAPIPFPDDRSYAAYQRRGGTLARDDWRRDNVDRFVEAMFRAVRQEKPWVKVGISPFGIWRPGEPAGICCFDAYAKLYADSRKWLRAGWADYFTPQLYWKISAQQQSYPVLLDWWVKENVQHRHLWIGNYLSRVGVGEAPWSAAEIDSQIRLTRRGGATGNVHFSMKALLANQGGVSDFLAAGVYAEPALVPESSWLPGRTPAAPRASLVAGAGGGPASVRLAPARGDRPWLWVVQARYGGIWRTDVVSGALETTVLRPPVTAGAPDEVQVRAVDRAGRLGPPTRATVAPRSASAPR